MLATQPEQVRRTRMEPDGPAKRSPFEWSDMFAPGKVTVTKAFSELSRHGGIGDPMTASREKGERIFAAIIEKLALVVQEIRAGNI